VKKFLIRCEISNVGGGWRAVRFDRDAGVGSWRATYEVPAGSCLTPKGEFVPKDWPPVYDEAGQDVWAEGFVFAELDEILAAVRLDGGHDVIIRVADVVLPGK
jgi:hypothetical protein